MSTLKCMITGCTLLILEEGKKVHGDFHMLDDTCIFNACLTNAGETAWQCTSRDPDPTELIVIVEAEYFERRGVIVFKEHSLNKAAQEYLA